MNGFLRFESFVGCASTAFTCLAFAFGWWLMFDERVEAFLARFTCAAAPPPYTPPAQESFIVSEWSKLPEVAGMSGTFVSLSDEAKAVVRSTLGYPPYGGVLSNWRRFADCDRLEWRMNNLSVAEIVIASACIDDIRSPGCGASVAVAAAQTIRFIMDVPFLDASQENSFQQSMKKAALECAR